MAFETEVDGHKIMIDADPAAGGQNRGPKPNLLMLSALGGCTAMDIVAILKKMRVEIEGLNVIKILFPVPPISFSGIFIAKIFFTSGI